VIVGTLNRLFSATDAKVVLLSVHGLGGGGGIKIMGNYP
jgi:hypothetical protein